MTKLITIEDLDRWEACFRGEGERHSDENLKRVSNDRPGLTLLEALRLDLKPGDLVWLAMRFYSENPCRVPVNFARACADGLPVSRFGTETVDGWAVRAEKASDSRAAHAAWRAAQLTASLLGWLWVLNKLIEVIEEEQDAKI